MLVEYNTYAPLVFEEALSDLKKIVWFYVQMEND